MSLAVIHLLNVTMQTGYPFEVASYIRTSIKEQYPAHEIASRVLELWG